MLKEAPGEPEARELVIPVRFSPSGVWLETASRLNFGAVPLAAPASERVLHITNSGETAPLRLALEGDEAFSLLGGDFDSVPARSRVDVRVQLRPSSTGQKTAALLLKREGPLCTELPERIPIEANVVGSAVSVTPGALDFGTSDCGTDPPPQTLALRNYGTTPAPWALSWPLGANASYEVVGPLTGTLAPAQEVLIAVRSKAAPSALGKVDDTLIVAADGTRISVPLTQKRRGAALTLGPNAVPARVKFGAPTTATVAITNTGDAPITVEPSAGVGSEFVVKTPGPVTIAPGATVPVDVTITAQRLGQRSGFLEFQSTGPHCGPLPKVDLAPYAYGRAVSMWGDYGLLLDDGSLYGAGGADRDPIGKLPASATALKRLSCYYDQGAAVPMCADFRWLTPRPDLAGVVAAPNGGHFQVMNDGTVRDQSLGLQPIPGLFDAEDAVQIMGLGGCVLRKTGAVECWGLGSELLDNFTGGRGDDGVYPSYLRESRLVVATDAVAIRGTEDHNRWFCVVHATGTIECWTANGYPVYEHVTYATPTDAIAIGGGVGRWRMCVVTKSKQIYCGEPPAALTLMGTADVVGMSRAEYGVILFVLADGRVVYAGLNTLVPLEYFD